MEVAHPRRLIVQQLQLEVGRGDDPRHTDLALRHVVTAGGCSEDLPSEGDGERRTKCWDLPNILRKLRGGDGYVGRHHTPSPGPVLLQLGGAGGLAEGLRGVVCSEKSVQDRVMT